MRRITSRISAGSEASALACGLLGIKAGGAGGTLLAGLTLLALPPEPILAAARGVVGRDGRRCGGGCGEAPPPSRLAGEADSDRDSEAPKGIGSGAALFGLLTPATDGSEATTAEATTAFVGPTTAASRACPLGRIGRRPLRPLATYSVPSSPSLNASSAVSPSAASYCAAEASCAASRAPSADDGEAALLALAAVAIVRS